jgi:phosphatidylserine/phosphatidylglycerophosphate/cardiolipin synthase-like enzyme
MHAKYGVVDDDWALVGTYNANAFGARLALETAVVVSDPRFVAKVAARHERDLARCHRVDVAAVEGRSFWTRELDACARAVMSLVDLALWPGGGRRGGGAAPALGCASPRTVP